MTHSTKAIYRLLLSDYVKVSKVSVEDMLYDENDIIRSMDKIEVSCINILLFGLLLSFFQFSVLLYWILLIDLVVNIIYWKNVCACLYRMSKNTICDCSLPTNETHTPLGHILPSFHNTADLPASLIASSYNYSCKFHLKY